MSQFFVCVVLEFRIVNLPHRNSLNVTEPYRNAMNGFIKGFVSFYEFQWGILGGGTQL